MLYIWIIQIPFALLLNFEADLSFLLGWQHDVDSTYRSCWNFNVDLNVFLDISTTISIKRCFNSV